MKYRPSSTNVTVSGREAFDQEAVTLWGKGTFLLTLIYLML